MEMHVQHYKHCKRNLFTIPIYCYGRQQQSTYGTVVLFSMSSTTATVHIYCKTFTFRHPRIDK